jgi:two-component system response regulator
MSQPVDILVVEDYEPDAHLLQLLFRRNHIMNEVHVAEDGSAAMDYIFARGIHAGRASEPMPMVVIMDIRLPKVDGWEVLRQLREDPRTHDLPVIMMSGSLFEKEVERAAALGANACISKPMQIEEFHDAMKKCGIAWAIADLSAI